MIVDASDFAAATAACRRREPVAHQLTYFLPREKAQAVRAIVAGCRMIRDAIDAPAKEGDCCGGGGGEGAGVVDLVRTQIDKACAGEIELPNADFRDESQHVLAAFADSLRRFEVPRRLTMDLIDACRDDLVTTRYATWNSLRRHCERLGGSIASLIACVLGATHSDIGRYANDLGAAARLNSILVNLKGDASRGRVYVPLEDLARCRYSERDLLAGVSDGRLAQLMTIQIDRVRELLDSAADGVCWLASDGSRLAAAMMIEVTRGQIDQIARSKPGDAHVEPPTKLALVRMLPRAARLARRQSDRPMPSMR